MRREHRYIFESMEAVDVLRRPEFEIAWQELLQISAPWNGLFRSPAWIKHLLQTGKGAVSICTVRDMKRQLVGLVPLRSESFPLTYELCSRRMLQRRLRTWRLRGSLPTLPEEEDLHAHRVPEILNFGLGDATYKRCFGLCGRRSPPSRRSSASPGKKTGQPAITDWSHRHRMA